MPAPHPDLRLPDEGRAAIFRGPGQLLEVTSFALPLLHPGEVLVRVLCTTICGSDLHTFHGRRHGPCPCVLGHEIVGHIEALGPDAPCIDLVGQLLTVGDRVTWTIAASCGVCFFCKRGLPQKCETLFKYGHAIWESERIFNGGYADYCVLRVGTGILRLPSGLPDALAATANCATSTVAAALRLVSATTPLHDSEALVLGAGTLGLSACAMLREAGARVVVCCDIDHSRATRALDFGATRAVTPDTLVTLTAVDTAFEFSGSPDAVSAAITALRIGGTALLAGTVLPSSPVELDPEQVVRRMLIIRGLHNYTPADLVTAVRFLDAAQHRYPLASLVAESFPLTSINEAFAAASTRPGFRVAVCP